MGDLLCQYSQYLPPKYVDCKCHLTYSIARVIIDLGQFTPQFLLDFGFFNQVIVQDPNQTIVFGRKLASTMLNLMSIGKQFVVAYI